MSSHRPVDASEGKGGGGGGEESVREQGQEREGKMCVNPLRSP
jgi:hypothetical protein